MQKKALYIVFSVVVLVCLCLSIAAIVIATKNNNNLSAFSGGVRNTWPPNIPTTVPTVQEVFDKYLKQYVGPNLFEMDTETSIIDHLKYPFRKWKEGIKNWDYVIENHAEVFYGRMPSEPNPRYSTSASTVLLVIDPTATDTLSAYKTMPVAEPDFLDYLDDYIYTTLFSTRPNTAKKIVEWRVLDMSSREGVGLDMIPGSNYKFYLLKFGVAGPKEFYLMD
jgi:hypothetical protein